MHWHVYCRVVDNFGDIGVAWRLAADLAARGESVRLAVDDPTPLAWMAPSKVAGIAVVGWGEWPRSLPDVVVEMFGGGLPDSLRETMTQASRLPVCIDLQHFSAEPYIERSHGLPSPPSTANRRTWTTWYFYPGLTAATGGLPREPEMLEQRRCFGDGTAWLGSLGIGTRGGERRVSLFCYGNDAVPELLDALATEPTLILLTPGHATQQVSAVLGPALRCGNLRAVQLPYLAQTDFDRLLWSSALNFVRGEDSLARAIWAGVPFVWQIYPQSDGAHVVKLEAFLKRLLSDMTPDVADHVRSLFRRWNGVTAAPMLATSSERRAAWSGHCGGWRDRLAAQGDLVSSLIEFVGTKR